MEFLKRKQKDSSNGGGINSQELLSGSDKSKLIFGLRESLQVRSVGSGAFISLPKRISRLVIEKELTSILNQLLLTSRSRLASELNRKLTPNELTFVLQYTIQSLPT